MSREFEIRREIELPATPEEVWDAVATAEGSDEVPAVMRPPGGTRPPPPPGGGGGGGPPRRGGGGGGFPQRGPPRGRGPRPRAPRRGGRGPPPATSPSAWRATAGSTRSRT